MIPPKWLGCETRLFHMKSKGLYTPCQTKMLGAIHNFCFSQGGAVEVCSQRPAPFLEYLWLMRLTWRTRVKEFGVGWCHGDVRESIKEQIWGAKEGLVPLQRGWGALGGGTPQCRWSSQNPASQLSALLSDAEWFDGAGSQGGYWVSGKAVQHQGIPLSQSGVCHHIMLDLMQQICQPTIIQKWLKSLSLTNKHRLSAGGRKCPVSIFRYAASANYKNISGSVF